MEVWRDSVQLVKKVYLLLSNYPTSEKYGLVSQISRSGLSISSNIAEGCSRDSQKEFSRYLQISLGSSFELETQLEISKELGFLSYEEHGEIIKELHIIQKRLQSLKKYAESKI